MNIRVSMLAVVCLIFASQSNTFAADEPNGLAKLARDDKWGEPNNGLVTQLIPQSEEYVIGKPMKFGLVLKNISDSVKQYDRFDSSFKSLVIKTPDNNRPYDKIGPYSTQEEPFISIAAGEIVALFENKDITEEHLILKPGKYTIQFRSYSKSELPKSNIIEFEVNPGTPEERDLLVASLLEILPDPNWHVTAPKMRRDRYEGQKVVSLGRGFKTKDSTGALLWLTKSPRKIFEQRQFVTINEYLGKSPSSYFYIEIRPKALDYWPTMKEDIIKALKLDSKSE